MTATAGAPATKDVQAAPADWVSSWPIAADLTSDFGKFFMNIHGNRLYFLRVPR